MSNQDSKRFLDRYPVDDTLADRPPPYLSVCRRTGDYKAYRADHLVQITLISDKELKLRVGEDNVVLTGHRLLPLYRSLCAGQVRELEVSAERAEFADGPTVESIRIERNIDGMPAGPLENYQREVAGKEAGGDAASQPERVD